MNLHESSALEIVALMNDEERTVLEAMDRAKGQIALAAEKAAECFRKGGRVIYLGAGTSGRLAVMDAAEMPPTFGIQQDRFIALIAGGTGASEKATEKAEDDASEAVAALVVLGIGPKDAVIGISASGSTPFVLSGIHYARQRGAWTCGIANNPGTPVLTESEHAVLLDTGPEVLTGSTRLKAGTAQKLALNRISTTAMVLNGLVVSNLMVGVKASNQKLKNRCINIVCELTCLSQDEARDRLEKHDWNIRAVIKESGTN